MENLPKYIIKALRKNHTSLGDHPAFPPEDEEKFVIKLLTKYYNGILEDVGSTDVPRLKNELSRLLSECIKKEQPIKDALEKLCIEVVNDMFNIPQDSIDIKVTLADTIDTSGQRMFPESTEDFEFDDIRDMNGLTDEVYKRRMLNCLIAGISVNMAYDVSNYIQNLFKIDPELPLLYKKILAVNGLLLYLEKDSDFDNDEQSTEGGIVDVKITNQDEMPIIDAQGLIFPVLLEETIKGLLELAISHGLPKDRERAMYVIKKSDFKLAEMWDLRLGMPLWERISSQIEDDVEPNFLMMELSKLKPAAFNSLLQEVFAGTKTGKRKLEKILGKIKRLKNADDFDRYIQIRNQEYPLEDGNFTSDELMINDNEMF